MTQPDHPATRAARAGHPATPALRLLRPLTEGRTYAQAAGLALDPFVGLALSLVLVSLLLLGSAVAVTVVGLPVLGEVIMIARATSAAERGRAHVLFGIRVDAPTPLDPPAGWWPRTRAMVADRAGWQAVGYALVLCFWGVLGLAAAAAWVTGIAAFLYPAWRWLWPVQAGSLGTLTSPAYLAAISAAGLVVAVGGAWLVRAAARVDAALVSRMLGPSSRDISRRVQELLASRARTVDHAAEERRRIERDLHDGVQARLVALAIDLGMARQRIEAGENPEAAVGLIGEAHEEAKRAVAELRDLARGVHPAILTDRGLDAALSALAARCPIPVEIEVALPGRPAAAVEAIAYFVIAEALTNITKHSQAGRAKVSVRPATDMVVVEVTDDGVGGAQPTGDGGLTGLRERLQGVDGHLTVSSPPGGPTVVRAELPCAS